MDVYDLIKILGIISMFFLTITFILGFFNFNIKNRFVIHKWFGIITLFLGIAHGFIVFYINYIK